MTDLYEDLKRCEALDAPPPKAESAVPPGASTCANEAQVEAWLGISFCQNSNERGKKTSGSEEGDVKLEMEESTATGSDEWPKISKQRPRREEKPNPAEKTLHHSVVSFFAKENSTEISDTRGVAGLRGDALLLRSGGRCRPLPRRLRRQTPEDVALRTTNKTSQIALEDH